ncbi:MAG: YaeQ family protein [Polyangiaceae bacterium]|nr:YaeQ family protein [Polyangiaceae bacterium]
MALSATIYRTTLEVSDIDRGIYETLEKRIAQHPSESKDRLATRILAYALFYDPRLEFGRGLSDTEEPGLWVRDYSGQILHWIDVGTPAPQRIHLAAKKSNKVTIVCHRGRDALARQIQKQRIFRREQVQVLYLEPAFVKALGEVTSRTGEWTILRHEDLVQVTIEGSTFEAPFQLVGLPGSPEPS